MSPIDHFHAVWVRCDHLSVIHGFLANNAAPALRPEELLRAEWAARVSALDLYVHELIAQRMVLIFEGALPKTDGYSGFQVPTETMDRIRAAATPADASRAFDLTVREQLGRKTFQYPDDIAAGVRLCSGIELWNEVAIRLGATQQNKTQQAKGHKQSLSQIIGRRNKIVHEGDLQPVIPRTPWPISQSDLAQVSTTISQLVLAIDAVV